MQHVNPCPFCGGIVKVHDNHWRCTRCEAEWTLGMRLIYEGNKIGAVMDDVFGPGEERPESLCVDTIYQCTASNATLLRCRLRIYRLNDQDVVMLSELPDSPGMSIADACCELLAAVANTYDLDETTLYIEHYPHTPPVYNLITVQWRNGTATHPQRRRMVVEEVERLTGVFLGDEAQLATLPVAWMDE